ncbi:alpha/beta hydrolase [Pseudalkalibacillus salsuginis]|uniref:alpha/beta hydrolase n=1 Tax=Pseudalkalibacillus salsuginis TaxID=2910972 RepID=UPI001EEB2FF4|nr:alpha/beta hydrolase-fold protein [Pseudalkalibacillus salsuginis]MCF6409428.1 alpha/beta hydrolase [Pseudalkalibacillus salsuginis]
MLENYSLKIAPFNQERVIRVYLPKSYEQSNQQYPVVYMHDGKNVFRDEDAVGGKSLELEHYLDENSIDLIVVGIDAPDTFEDRADQYCPWKNGEYCRTYFGDERDIGGKGKEYVSFIVEELKPSIDKKYRTQVDQTTMAGISLGGLISTYAACRYPSIFSKAAGLSTGFWRNQDEIEALLKTTDFSANKGIYLDCGTYETNDEKINAEFLKSNLRIKSILQDTVPNFIFKIIDGGEHDYHYFQKRVPDLVEFILHGSLKTTAQS